jgi:hypothetical protein
MCAVEDGDGCGRVKAFGEKRGREAGGAAADYRDITDTRERRGQASSVRAYDEAFAVLEIVPHAWQRTIALSVSVLPMTSVRWLPHFGHTGGASGRLSVSSPSLE